MSLAVLSSRCVPGAAGPCNDGRFDWSPDDDAARPPRSAQRRQALDAGQRPRAPQRLAGHAPIETRHSVQIAFGCLDDVSMRCVAGPLDLPLSKIYVVATFYHLPKGRHASVVCATTACYIKGAAGLIKAVGQRLGAAPGQTTDDDRLSVLTARCIGACGLAPALVLDGHVLGKPSAEVLLARIAERSRRHLAPVPGQAAAGAAGTRVRTRRRYPGAEGGRAADLRHRVVAATLTLLRQGGLSAAGLNEVVALARRPKG